MPLSVRQDATKEDENERERAGRGGDALDAAYLRWNAGIYKANEEIDIVS